MKRWFAVLLMAGLAMSFLAVNGFSEEEEKANVKFRLLGQVQDDLCMPGFNPRHYDLYWSWRLDYWFGGLYWMAFSDASDTAYFGTFTRLYGQPGTVVPLHESRIVQRTESQNRLGAEIEVRLKDNLWLGAAYVPHKSYSIDSVENMDFVEFEIFNETYANEKESYYEYFLQMNRYGIIEYTHEKFSANNFQLYMKHEAGDSIKVFAGIGLDVWYLRQKIDKTKIICEMLPWSGAQIREALEQTTSKINSDWCVRGLFLVGAELPINKNLSIGASTRFFLEKKKLYYDRSFSLYVSTPLGKKWELQLPNSSMLLFLSLNF